MDIPRSFGQGEQFRVVRKLGEGGMAVVYLAVDMVLLRPVAIKVPRADLAADPELITRRFLQETVAQARVGHPGAVAIHQAGAEVLEGRLTPYLVLEFVAGMSVEDCYQPPNEGGFGPMPPVTAARIVLNVLRTFAVMHANGIIHRDVKPSNIMLGWDEDVVKVMDFGTARAFQDAFDNAPRETKTTMALFSLGYSSPEQMRSVKDADAMSDLYSIAATLYSMVTGVMPDGLNAYGIDSDEFRMVPEFLRDVIFLATRHKKEDRPHKTAAKMARAIRQAVDGQPDDGVPFWRWLARRRAESTVDAQIRRALAGEEQVVISDTETVQAGFTRWYVSEEAAIAAGAVRGTSFHVPVPPAPEPRPFLTRTRALATFGVGMLALALAIVSRPQVPAVDPPPVDPAAEAAPEPVPEPTPVSASVPVSAPASLPTIAAVKAPAPAGHPTSVPKPMATTSDPMPAVAVTESPPSVPAKVVPPPAEPPRGTVLFDGGAQDVRFVGSDGRIHGAGKLAPGTYEIRATFPGKGVVPAGTINVLPDQIQTVACNEAFSICKAH